mgnify:CR=1 FL=1
MKTKTYTAGANAERTAIRAKIRRLAKSDAIKNVNGYQVLDVLLDWLWDRHFRYNGKKGGLGR